MNIPPPHDRGADGHAGRMLNRWLIAAWASGAFLLLVLPVITQHVVAQSEPARAIAAAKQVGATTEERAAGILAASVSPAAAWLDALRHVSLAVCAFCVLKVLQWYARASREKEGVPRA